MIIAHLPAGYIVSRFVTGRAEQIALMAGSVAPDLDLLYFLTIDQRAHHHHTYQTHTPRPRQHGGA